MATEVDVCNLALARLGDEANVQSINPPDGSTQAALCAAFYPQARDTLLSLRPWGFATQRQRLAAVAGAAALTPWAHACALPVNTLLVRKVLAEDAADDVGVGGVATAQPFTVEAAADGSRVLRCNLAAPVAMLVMRVEDAGLFPPLFVDALSWLLASYLAGPVVKGDAGRAAAAQADAVFQQMLRSAGAADAGQQRSASTLLAPWLAVRG